MVKSFVFGGRPIGLGTRLLNVNRQGLLVWPTRTKVVRWDPEREVAYSAGRSRSRPGCARGCA